MPAMERVSPSASVKPSSSSEVVKEKAVSSVVEKDPATKGSSLLSSVLTVAIDVALSRLSAALSAMAPPTR